MLLGLLLVAVAAASWGTTGATMAWLARDADASPLLVGWSRLAIAAPCLVLAASVVPRPAARHATPRRWPSRADLPLCAALGLAMAAYQVCYFRAVTLTGVAAATDPACSLSPDHGLIEKARTDALDPAAPALVYRAPGRSVTA